MKKVLNCICTALVATGVVLFVSSAMAATPAPMVSLEREDSLRAVQAATKVTICHNGHSITVAESAVAAHVANHGDTIGACTDACPPDGCLCTLIFDPVDCDQGRFANQCFADCEEATNCVPANDCVCSHIFDPVLCDDGSIWANQCIADCNDQVGCEPLFPLCGCSHIFLPVVCDKGIYANQCLADCDGADNCGPLGGDGVCPLIFNPVRCADGNIYANICFAESAFAPGPCTEIALDPGCACPLNIAPVRCGDDVYLNLCIAVCTLGVDGAAGCLDACVCERDFNPVACGDCPRQIFANPCKALCAGFSPSDCNFQCACPQIVAPVGCTDTNGDPQVYINACVAACELATGCSQITPCPLIVDPVRGETTGTIYLNDCFCFAAVPAESACPRVQPI